MKLIFKLICLILLIPMTYVMWATYNWETASDEIGVTETCRRHTKEPSKPFDCIVRLVDGGTAGVSNIIFETDEINIRNVSGRKITLKVEVNKLQKNHKRYTYISPS